MPATPLCAPGDKAALCGRGRRGARRFGRPLNARPPAPYGLPQLPIMLKGHERPITLVKYNREGDLLFSVAKDNKPTLWYSDTGERVGTYEGHGGAVFGLDVTGTS